MSNLYESEISNDPDVIEAKGRAGNIQQLIVAPVDIPGAIKSIAGQPGPDILLNASNGITISPAANTITFSLTQNLQTSGTPTFADLTLTDDLIVGDDAAVTGDLTTGTLAIGGGAVITKILTATATLDFGSTATQTSTDLTITVTGAAVGNAVFLGVPNGSVNADSCFTAWVSATNTVTVRFNNYSTGAIDPASGTFRVVVVQF